MDLTLSCFGLTTAINLHRSQAGSHLVRIPNTARVLDVLTEAFWSSSSEEVERLASTFNAPKFWAGEEGYEFSREHLPGLLQGENPRFLDVGCSVGQLVTFLQETRFWSQLEYIGVDADAEAVRVAQQRHADADFQVCDAQTTLSEALGRFDIVFTKGTICSTYRPFDALDAILDCSSKSALLVHTACTTSDCGEDGFVTTLYASKSNAYVFTIMNIERLQDRIRERGFDVAVRTIRKHPKNVLNLGAYRLYDFVLHRT
ncbi:MAG: class I SAM-dependent methyltransferase [Bythopirellula sp.]